MRGSATGWDEVRTAKVSGEPVKTTSNGDLKASCIAPTSGKKIALDLTDSFFIEEAKERVR